MARCSQEWMQIATRFIVLANAGAAIATLSFLGVAIAGGAIDEPELQRRVQESERSIRENAFWIIAFISAIASVISAMAACIAVLSN